MTMVGKIEIKNAVKAFETTTAVDGVSTTIKDGEFVTIVGPSGCGKTTLLRSIAGLERLDNGEIRIADDIIESPADNIHMPPDQRDIGMVFQSYALWPHMSVFENVAYPLKVGGSSGSVNKRVTDTLQLVGIEDKADEYPPNLSGGQQQRVALARAIVPDPDVILFDEPLSNLDAKLREHMQKELQALHKELGFTSVYVTHNQSEAMALSDEVIVMNEGAFVQRDTPKEIYRSPQSDFVAQFIGHNNMFKGTVQSVNGKRASVRLVRPRINGLDRLLIKDTSVKGIDEGSDVIVLIRPEIIALVDGRDVNKENRLSATVSQTRFMGAFEEVELKSADGDMITAVINGQHDGIGNKENFSIDPEGVRVLPDPA